MKKKNYNNTHHIKTKKLSVTLRSKIIVKSRGTLLCLESKSLMYNQVCYTQDQLINSVIEYS